MSVYVELDYGQNVVHITRNGVKRTYLNPSPFVAETLVRLSRGKLQVNIKRLKTFVFTWKE